MKKPDTMQGSLDLLALKILSRRPDLHGYAIMSAIRQISDDVLNAEEGSLYPALHRMEEAGWIRASWVTPDRRRQTATGVRRGALARRQRSHQAGAASGITMR